MDETAEYVDKRSLDNIGMAAMLVAVAVSFVFAGVFCACLYKDHDTGQSLVLESTININAEPIGSIERLSAIGPARAQAIVAYRQEHSDPKAGRPAFRNAADLVQIKGIGAKTVEKLKQYVRFE
jgi:competence ComEA-like helix-hairpin-helix protein